MASSQTLSTTRPAPAVPLPAASVEEPYYYLQNFETVVSWVLRSHRDLLLAAEIEILEKLPLLPLEARALLVRMIMRKGTVFRASKLRYAEIGPVAQAALPLISQGWVEADSSLDLPGLFALLTREEIAAVFARHLPGKGRKLEWLAELQPRFGAPQRFSEWCTASDDCIYTLLLMPLCDRLRLMFFGNLHQDWSEFVLADLGIYRYETVEFSATSRVFRSRRDVDDYLNLHRCRERLEHEAPVEEILDELPLIETGNPWIERRRAKLLFRIGQHCERSGDLERARAIYADIGYPGARARCVRVLERLHRFDEALALCRAALLCPESEEESQQLQRMSPRLQRRLGARVTPRRADKSYARIDLVLPQPTARFYVEGVVQELLHRDDAPIHYVENTLVNSLFGLLCWQAVFAPVPGAFFHPFQSGPADLLHPDFYRARSDLFDALLAQLDTGEYLATIRGNYLAKQGLQSPFVYWSALDENLLEQALACLPAAHLRKLFERLLANVKSNRAGLPDLIQFWPHERRYQMIEVKGPGDRLQDNQVRWLDYCHRHDMPVAVCYVQWQGAER